MALIALVFVAAAFGGESVWAAGSVKIHIQVIEASKSSTAFDKQLENLLEFRENLAIVVVRGLREERRSGGPTVRSLADASRFLPSDDDAEDLDERAGIQQHDGGMDRDTSERAALLGYVKRGGKKP